MKKVYWSWAVRSNSFPGRVAVWLPRDGHHHLTMTEARKIARDLRAYLSRRPKRSRKEK